MAQAKPADIFFDKLCEALRTRRKPVTKRERSLAQGLQAVLWDAAKQVSSFVDSRGDEAVITASNAARAEADRAEAITQLATRLLKRLPSGSIGDLLSGWSWSVVKARIELTKVIEDAKVVAARSRKSARRSPGRRANSHRETLNEWVALQLCTAGVRPTTAKTGTFARVLCVVQGAAGFPNRTLANVERDVRKALSVPFVADYLARTATQSHPENIRNV